MRTRSAAVSSMPARAIQVAAAGILLLLILHAVDSPRVATTASPADSTATMPTLLAIQDLLAASRFEAAERQARHLLALTVAEHGSESLQAAEVLDAIVESLWHLGKAKAPETHRLAGEAARIKSSLVDSSDVRLASSLRNLGIVDELSGNFTRALTHYRRVLGIYERAQDPRVAEIHADLAIALNRTGEYQEAIARFEEALKVLYSMPQPDELRIASAFNGLGGTLWEVGDYGEARTRYEKCLDIRRRLLGHDHPKVAETENNLAVLLMDEGDYDLAKELYVHVVSVRKIKYGDRHPLVGRALTNLALVHFRKGDPEAARETYAQALTILDENLDADTVDCPSRSCSPSSYRRVVRAPTLSGSGVRGTSTL